MEENGATTFLKALVVLDEARKAGKIDYKHPFLALEAVYWDIGTLVFRVLGYWDIGHIALDWSTSKEIGITCHYNYFPFPSAH